MPNADAIRLIADNLAALTHPGNNTGKPVVLPLPMFRSSGIPADQAEQFAQDAGLPHADITTLVAEAIVHLLETHGQPPTPKTQIEQLQAIASTNADQGDREIEFYCGGSDRALLFTGRVQEFDANKVTITPQVLRLIQTISPECALAHQPVSL